MSTFNGTLKDDNLQFYRKKTNKNLIEIVTSFNIDKIKIGAITYNLANDIGSRKDQSVDFYMSIEQFELLCHDILTGNISKRIKSGDNPEPYMGGSKKDGKIRARILSMFSGTKTDVVFAFYEGPGKENPDTGGYIPDYKYKEADTAIMIGLTNQELKSFALQGKRALDFYYRYYFGRKEKDEK